MGRAITYYSDIAAKVCSIKAARAVGAAVGKNPIPFRVPFFAWLGKNGNLTGYHMGTDPQTRDAGLGRLRRATA